MPELHGDLVFIWMAWGIAVIPVPIHNMYYIHSIQFYKSWESNPDFTLKFLLYLCFHLIKKQQIHAHKPAGGNHRAVEPGRILTIVRSVWRWDLRDVEDG